MDSRGSKIRAQRERNGWKMAQAAEHCDVDVATISRLEAGKMPHASFTVLAKVARGLGMSLDDLLDEEHDERPAVHLVAGGTA